MTNENDRMEALVAEGIEAIRLTREYVGEKMLPEIEGWSWYDWTQKAKAALQATPAASMEALARELLEIASDGLGTVYEMGRENAHPIVKLLTDKADETNQKLWEHGLGQLQATPTSVACSDPECTYVPFHIMSCQATPAATEPAAPVEQRCDVALEPCVKGDTEFEHDVCTTHPQIAWDGHVTCGTFNKQEVDDEQ